MQRIRLVVVLSAALTACAGNSRYASSSSSSATPYGPASPAAERYFASRPGAVPPPEPASAPRIVASPPADNPPAGTAYRTYPFARAETQGQPLPGILSSGPGRSGPAAMTFRFGVGDEIATSVWKEPELSTSQRIMADGSISPPLLKSMRVVGMTVDDVQAALTRSYSEYLKDPKVSVRVAAIQADRAFVLGEVRSPQAVTLVGPTTVLQAITMAGGFAEETAEKGQVHLIRKGSDGEATMTRVDIRDVLSGRTLDRPVERGDMVFVPAKGISDWARFMGQLFSPLSTAVGTASAVTTVQQAR